MKSQPARALGNEARPQATVVSLPARASAMPSRRFHGDGAALAILLGIPLAVTAWGAGYYLLDRAARLRDPLHALLKPSGPVGLALGIVAFALFLFLWLYPLRKRVRWLAWTGAVGSWLRVHVVAGLSLPVIAATHAGWRFEGLIGLGYLSMFVVALSGIIGRYLYSHIPRSRQGAELSRDEVARERRALLTEIAIATGLDPMEAERALALGPAPAGAGPLRALAHMVRDDFWRWRALRRLRRVLTARVTPLDRAVVKRAMRLARREMALAQQVRLLDQVRRVFGWWHVAHRPFAATALIAVVVHVVVAVLVGGIGLR
jgi:hypothetical protein